MSLTAGSKRRYNIVGFVVVGQSEPITHLRRLGNGELHQLFRHAQESGQARVILDEEQYTLHRHSDHTFSLELGAYGHVVF